MSELFDPTTTAFAASIVSLTAVVVFLVDTSMRRSRGAARIWGFAFLALGVAAFSRLASYTSEPEAWIALALADACFVSFLGALWSGMRRYNGRSSRWATFAWAVPAVVLLAASPTVVATGIPALRLAPLTATVGALAVMAAIESRRGRLGRRDTQVLTIVLGAVGLLNAVWFLWVLLDPAHHRAGGYGAYPIATAVSAMVLAVVAVTTLVARRAADDVPPAAQLDAREFQVDVDGALVAGSLGPIVELLGTRAQDKGEQIAVLAMTAADLPGIATALGADVQQRLERVWRASWLQHLPVAAIPGAGGPGALIAILAPSTVGEANRIGNRVYGRVVEDLSRLEGSVLPVTGFGVAMSGSIPLATLIESACEAARRSATGEDRGRLVVSGEDIVERTLPPRA